MAQVLVDVGNYIFAPGGAGAGTITFTGITISNIEQIAPIINGNAPAASAQIFNPAIERFGTLVNNVLTLDFNTSGQQATDKLIICFNQPGTIQDYGIEMGLGNLPGTVSVQMGSRNPDVGLEIEEVGDIGAFYTMDYDTGTVIFVAGLVVTGTSSGTTAIISVVDGTSSAGTLTLRGVSGGPFTTGEAITDSGTGAALVDATTAETKLRAVQLPTAGNQFEVVCESVDDSIIGTGAGLVLIEFIEEATGASVVEVIATSGQTPALFVSTDCFRFRSALVILHGSTPNVVVGGNNAGPVIIRESISKNIQGAILTDDVSGSEERGINVSQGSNYTVPAGKIAVSMFVLVNAPKGEDSLFWVAVRPVGVTGFLQLSQATVYQATYQVDFSDFPQGLSAGTDVRFLVQASNAGTLANATLIVVEKTI